MTLLSTSVPTAVEAKDDYTVAADEATSAPGTYFGAEMGGAGGDVSFTAGENLVVIEDEILAAAAWAFKHRVLRSSQTPTLLSPCSPCWSE